MTYLPEKHTFSKEHLWIKKFEKKVYVGFTNHFLSTLGKIDVVDIRQGMQFKKGESCGVIYGKVKKQNMIMPVSGTILSVNMNSFLDPTVFNQESYNHWVMIIDVQFPEELKELLSPAKYKKTINSITTK
jgi:glycine cleavage system H protein